MGKVVGNEQTHIYHFQFFCVLNFIIFIIILLIEGSCRVEDCKKRHFSVRRTFFSPLGAQVVLQAWHDRNTNSSTTLTRHKDEVSLEGFRSQANNSFTWTEREGARFATDERKKNFTVNILSLSLEREIF